MSPSDEGARAVNAYLDALPGERREALQRLRDIIHGAAPGATERVAYGIPIVRLARGPRRLLGLRPPPLPRTS